MSHEIPDTISKQERQTLTKRFMTAKIGPQAHKNVDGLSAPQSMLSKVSKVLPKTKKSRKPRAPAISGNASNIPISID